MPVSCSQLLVQSVRTPDCTLDAARAGVCVAHPCTLDAWPRDIVGAPCDAMGPF